MTTTEAHAMTNSNAAQASAGPFDKLQHGMLLDLLSLLFKAFLTTGEN
jgi:hypothetical protein